LTPEVVAAVDAHACDAIAAGLRSGTLVTGLPALERAPLTGLGHSAGAYLAVVQQARFHTFDSLVLLGFCGRGLDSHLTDEERRYAGDPDGLRLAISDLVKARFGKPLPGGGTATSKFLIRGEVPKPALAAIGAASSPLLALVGLTTMVPGSAAAELAAVDVPVFLGVGDMDITGDPHAIPSELPNSQDITLFVLRGSGHNHNVESTRAVLWDRIARWVGCLG
jgi:hypothetical protein